MSRVIIVDDEKGVLNALKRSMRSHGWNLQTYLDPQEALNDAATQEVDLVISDYRMPVMDGVTFLQEFKAIQPDAFRIILSGQADMDAILHAINDAEIYRFITKPWSDEELAVTIEKALEHRHILIENRRLADMVRKQQVQIKHQMSELERLEAESPGITQINWGDDGSIILYDEDEDEG
ncbi:MAG: response regulator [Motiliproteus sp.]|nr:response regulator [Motiliproteus sp.]MCW9053991.1 response regulator [Motiliproteus sp.]